MDRREAVLRELNLYPQWVRRGATTVGAIDETTDMTTSHLTNPAKDAGQVIGYSHSAKLANNASQAAGYHKSPLPELIVTATVLRENLVKLADIPLIFRV